MSRAAPNDGVVDREAPIPPDRKLLDFGSSRVRDKQVVAPQPPTARSVSPAAVVAEIAVTSVSAP